MEDFRAFLKDLVEYQGRILGGLIGLMAGLIWAFMGFWRAFAFVLCIAVGYFVGKRIDRKESLKDIISRVLPPKN
ncbi:MAG TPA: DUF2273 domain-containing protein [Bacillota bacterium]|nr:DUF2273 domain-containing protein [Bacillota bacterium]